MLVLSRRADESIYIELDPQAPDDLTARELFSQGPIKVTVLASGISFARIGVLTPANMRIVRAELDLRREVADDETDEDEITGDETDDDEASANGSGEPPPGGGQ